MATVSRGLPDRPHLDVPKREARALLKEWRARLPEALDRIGRRHPKFREADPAAISAGKFLLNDAQLERNRRDDGKRQRLGAFYVEIEVGHTGVRQGGGSTGAPGVIGLRASGLTPVDRRAVTLSRPPSFLMPGSVVGGELPWRTPGMCAGASGDVSGSPTLKL